MLLPSLLVLLLPRSDICSCSSYIFVLSFLLYNTVWDPIPKVLLFSGHSLCLCQLSLTMKWNITIMSIPAFRLSNSSIFCSSWPGNWITCFQVFRLSAERNTLQLRMLEYISHLYFWSSWERGKQHTLKPSETFPQSLPLVWAHQSQRWQHRWNPVPLRWSEC